MFCVYKHTSPEGKVYIGIASGNPLNRWRNGKGYKQNVHFYGAIIKYGWDNFKHEILFDGLSKEEACEKEIELIAEFKSNNSDFGYNHSIGGECSALGSKHTETTRQKMRDSRKGEKCYWYGKKRSEETKRKISENKKGKPMNDKTRAALLYAVNHQSQESRSKISATLTGNQRAVKSKVLCVETGIVYDSTVSAAKETGICRSTIGKVCNHKPKYQTAGGFHWEYYSGGD